MEVGGGQEYVNAGKRRAFQGLPGALNVRRTGSRQACDGRPAQGCRDGLDGFEITVGRDGKPGFNDVHTHTIELACQTQLFVNVHTAARRLFAVSQSGVEHPNPRSFHERKPPWIEKTMLRRQEDKAKLIILQTS